MAKEKKLGVTSYYKYTEHDYSSIFCRITYDKKKIEIKSPTVLSNGEWLELQKPKIHLNDISNNDSRIIHGIKMVLEKNSADFELTKLKKKRIQEFFKPASSFVYQYSATLISDILKDSHPQTSSFAIYLVENYPELKFEKFWNVVQEVSESKAQEFASQFGKFHREFQDLIKQYHEENNIIKCTGIDIMASTELELFIFKNGNQECIEHFIKLKDSLINSVNKNNRE